jgi:hypothetical protein
VVSLLVEKPHSDLSKLTRMVLVHVYSVVVDHQQDLDHWDACGACLHDRACRDMAATVRELSVSTVVSQLRQSSQI